MLQKVNKKAGIITIPPEALINWVVRSYDILGVVLITCEQDGSINIISKGLDQADVKETLEIALGIIE
jgi:hypothetical protein